MKTGMTVLAVNILTVGSLFAQVHIRESATISPVERGKVISSQTHYLSFQLSLAVPAYVNVSVGRQRCEGGVLQFVDTAAYSGDKVRSYAFDFTTVGDYYMGAYLNVTEGLPADTFKWSLYGDGLLVASDSGYIPEQPSHESGVFHYRLIWSGIFSASYYSTFDLSVGTSGGGWGWPLLEGGRAWIQTQGVVDCSSNIWSPHSDSLTLSIVSGGRHASFHRLNPQTGGDDSLGEKVTTIGDSAFLYWLDADGLQPESTGNWVVIEGQSNSLTDRDSVFLEPINLVHFKAYHLPVVQNAGWISVWLEALDKNDRRVVIPDSALINILPDSATMKYGSIIAGDVKGKEMRGIPWSLLSYGSFAYVADGKDPQGPVNVHIEITFSGENVEPTDIEFQLLPQPVIVTVTPSSIMPGDTALITVQQRNEDGSLSDFAEDKQFEIGILSGEEYGEILLSDEIKGGYFSNVLQPFEFIAADSIDRDSVRVGIRVGAREPILGSAEAAEKTGGDRNPPGKGSSPTVRSSSGHIGRKSISDASFFSWSEFGIGWVGIKAGVKIKVTADKATLMPLGDGDNRKADPKCTVPKGKPDTCQRIIDFSKRKKVKVTVTVTDNVNYPVPNYPFILSAYVRPQSGGHDHDENRPTGKFITRGGDTLANFRDTTDSKGKLTYTYICSGFGGVDSVFVRGRSDRDTSSTTILLRFDGLQELTEGDHYVLIGKTATHGKNHYGTTTTLSRLEALADSAYADSSWVLQYNDMSLINGGPFDHMHNWNTPHRNHREGTNTDIRPVSREGRSISLPWIRKLLQKKNWGTIQEEDAASPNHHFHFKFQ